MNELIQKVKQKFDDLQKTGMLFRVNVGGSEIYDKYLQSFPEGSNPVFRDPNSSMHNCNCCNNFIRRYGNIVGIVDGKITSMFNVECEYPFNEVAEKVVTFIESHNIVSVFFEHYDTLDKYLNYEKVNKNQEKFKLGIEKNFKMYSKEEAEMYGVVKEGEVREFNHLNVLLNKRFVIFQRNTSVDSIIASYRDKYSVFKRTMEEIPSEVFELAIDLINQNSLLNGASYVDNVIRVLALKKEYDKIPQEQRDIWLWTKTYYLHEGIAKLKNHLIGTFLEDIAGGRGLNEACKEFNIRVDPINYQKASAPITQKQINEAQKFVEENGYIDSFNRRLATIDDIKVNEILHVNKDGVKKSVSIFDSVKATAKTSKPDFKGIEEIGIEKFMKDILPTCTSVEAYFEGRMSGNLVNLTTSAENSKQIFKWNNQFGYTFNGNLAGKSMIKEAVKNAGGKISGDLRFSISWNEDGRSVCDLDAHAVCPNAEISFRNKNTGGGWLDVDMINPTEMGVENIIFPSRSGMSKGEYTLYIHNYNGRNNFDAKAEIEFDGQIYLYEVGTVSTRTNIAKVKLDANGNFTIQHLIEPSSSVSKEIWGIDTNKFHKVNLVCLSPNFWGNNNIGNKFYLFMIDGCKNDSPVRGFHNEHLTSELLTHRKVLDVLGVKAMIEPTDNQLAGLGFNATVKDELILKLTGSFNRVIKVIF